MDKTNLSASIIRKSRIIEIFYYLAKYVLGFVNIFLLELVLRDVQQSYGTNFQPLPII